MRLSSKPHWSKLLCEVFLAELSIIVMVGGIPVLLSYYLGGDSMLENTLSSLLPSGFTLKYAFIITVIALVINLIDRYFRVPSFLSKKKYIFSEIGTSLLGALRLTSGVLITFSAIWYVYESETWNPVQGHSFIYIGILGYFECVLLSISHNWVMSKKRILA